MPILEEGIQRENEQPEAGCVGQVCCARVISPLRQHGLSIELQRRNKAERRSRERCKRTLEAGNEYGSKAKLVILRSCRRCP